MRIRRVVSHRFRSLFRRVRADAEMERELELHIEQLAREHAAAGMSREEARLLALREFGSLQQTKEECRDMRRVNLVEDFAKDLAYSFRMLRKSPGFAATAVLSLALAIGANTAIFSVVNTFLLRPLPFSQPERLVTVFERNVIGDEQQTYAAPGNFLEWRKNSTTFEQMSAYTFRNATLSTGNPAFVPQRILICACSGNLFDTLGVTPILGRRFNPDEDRGGAPHVVIISHKLWQQQFGGAADIVGKTIHLNGDPFQVIGVTPRGFVYPYRNVDVWRPILTVLAPQLLLRHDLHFLQVVGRVRAGISISQARAEIDGISARYKKAHPDESTGKGANVVPLHASIVQDVRKPLFVLLGAVGCVLLIACVNIANLMLTRAVARTREIAVRAALGAARSRIVRQLVTETVVVAVAGGALGAILAVSITGVLVAHAPGGGVFLPADRVPVDPVVFLFAFTLALLTGVGVGLFPAIRVSRADLADRLKDNTRSSTATRAHGRFRNILVAAEIALSVVLLIASGLLMRSFFLLYQVQPGVRMDHTLTMNVSLPPGYNQPAQQSAMLADLGERAQRTPGVTSAGLTSCPPLSGTCNILFFYVDGRPFVSGKFQTAAEYSVDPAYFAAAGIPLLRGRTLNRQDGTGFDPKHPRLGSIVISESMAKRIFPNEDPIGKRIFFDFELQQSRNEGTPVPRYEIVGIAADVLPTIDRQPEPTLYRPLLDNTSNTATLLLHTAVDPQSVVSAVRNEIRTLNPGLVVFRIQTLDELVGLSTSGRQFNMMLFAVFAGLALLLATVGLYGLVSYAVSQRTSEIGIRVALGATRSDVSRMVVLEGLRPAIAGMALGVLAAVAACRILRSQLFGVTPADPLTFALVPLLLLTVATLACYMPSVRASRLDPTTALRTE